MRRPAKALRRVVQPERSDFRMYVPDLVARLVEQCAHTFHLSTVQLHTVVAHHLGHRIYVGRGCVRAPANRFERLKRASQCVDACALDLRELGRDSLLPFNALTLRLEQMRQDSCMKQEISNNIHASNKSSLLSHCTPRTIHRILQVDCVASYVWHQCNCV